MKILYVNPARLESGLDAIIKGAPLSLMSIAAMVPEHDAKLFDFKVDKYVEKRFQRELNRYDVVAITSMTPQIYHALEVAKMAKQEGCITIMGGYHPTLAPEYVAKHPEVDYTIRGEGEHTFHEIVDFIDGKRKNIALKEIDGISYKNNDGQVIHNKDRRLEYNLDNFPLPRRDLVRGKNYSYMGAKVDQVESSRGCPFSCKFCCISKMWKDPINHISYRTKSLKRIMQEVYDVGWRWRKDFIFFCEDNFTINVKRTNKILDTLIKAGVTNKLYFSAQSRVDTLFRNPWLVKKLAKAGFRQIFLGIESVHQQSLDAMGKQITPKMIRKVVKMLQDEGISIFGGVIIGYPGETFEMVHQNILFTKSLNLSCVQFTPITAFPGTEFYDEMKANGMITSNNFKNYDLFHPMMRTEQLSNREMYRLVAQAYACYFLDGDWLKIMGKQYLNPFSKFNWMIPSMFQLIKQMLFGAHKMMHTQGICSAIIPEALKHKKNSVKVKQQKNKGSTLIPSQESLLVPTKH